jgi:citrate lyase alpha subunit
MKHSEDSKDERTLAELLEEALARPGVQDLMDVYQHWRVAEGAAHLHRQVAAVQKVVFSSDSSAARDCP